ncbi:hypothetical protein CVS48_24480 [Achromobacter spanius]|nr:hypothetical protein CVS48_24480 [Achromobacter spanius]
MLARFPSLGHTETVAETNATWFGDQTIDRRTHRPLAVFLRLYALARLLWAGDCGEGLRPAGVLSSRFANPAFCPPTSFGDETRASTNSIGAIRG